jgi:hypothetical protein
MPFTRIAQQTPSPVDQMLWKLGFNPPQYDDFSQRFTAHLQRFEEAVLSLPDKPTENDRERIRASGVNLFVYVEQMLDMLVSFNVWLLATDHFLESKHVFDMVEARRSVPKVLGASLAAEDTEVQWHSEGENALGVLLRYLSESLIWCKCLADRDRSSLKRPKADEPHFAEGMQARFPFQNTELWADAHVMELRTYVQSYEKLAGLLLQADLAHVRNGLDHMRDEMRFPTSEKMLACISRLRQAEHLAELNRFLPVILWLDKIDASRFGLSDYQFRDVSNRLVVVHAPLPKRARTNAAICNRARESTWRSERDPSFQLPRTHRVRRLLARLSAQKAHSRERCRSTGCGNRKYQRRGSRRCSRWMLRTHSCRRRPKGRA